MLYDFNFFKGKVGEGIHVGIRGCWVFCLAEILADFHLLLAKIEKYPPDWQHYSLFSLKYPPFSSKSKKRAGYPHAQTIIHEGIE